MNWDWNQLLQWPTDQTPMDIWLTQLFVIVLCTVSVNFILMRSIDVAERLIGKTDTLWDDALLEAARIPVRLVFWVIGLSVSMELLQAVSTEKNALFELVPQARRIAFIIIIAMFLNRFVSYTEKNLIDPGRMRKPMDRSTAAAVAKLLRVSVIITSLLIILQTLGYSISGVLAFGGIGGMAVAFAAKDLLANFFGGMMVYLDKPFRVGDWVRSPDRSIEGSVEDIGWRLTRIRTFDQRPLYIPNAMFTSIVLENPSRMYNRRINEKVGIRYDDWQKMPGIVADVRAMLIDHEDLETENRTLIVNFDSYGASHLEFFIYTFTKTTQWVQYHEIKQDVLMKIMSIVHEHGAEFAFPTRTLHLVSQNDDAPATGLEDNNPEDAQHVQR
ncbi:mechanosensitive ion channel family protein [Alcanivorax sp.]|uniref:mechanosensitive ion channel family protein n=1 Tax=Alcanivorax sp. TaxID=1872427 RepID=UPI000C4DCBC4|nr:mechanosensitive ion channel family protein [Alcanivorax sp.]MBQ25217.1 mechanosensitive ion channel protein MscS [Alcanivorax sp.]|tara:strand:- start:726 stop:1883 length:1158 start_codon:yes stop_codon:yes gene_type:complete